MFKVSGYRRYRGYKGYSPDHRDWMQKCSAGNVPLFLSCVLHGKRVIARSTATKAWGRQESADKVNEWH